jgi:hypothetical protein
VKARGTTLAVVAATLASLAYWAPALLAPGATGLGDWQMVHHNWEVGWVALTRHGEWPLWDPYHCGGVTMLGNPESQHFSPWFLLAFLVGPTAGIKAMLVAHTALGVLGMRAYARDVLGLSAPATWLAALSWSFSGFFAWHGAGGHGTFLAFDYLPWLLLGWRRALVDVRHAVPVALLLALTVAEGGTYPLPYMGLALALEALWLLRRPEVRLPALRAALVVTVLFPLVAAVRLVPILEALRRFPRAMASIDRLTPADIVTALTERTHAWRWPGHEFVWPEYGAFMGWTVLALAALAVLSLVLRRPHTRRHTVLLHAGLAAFFFALILGNGPLRPWPWLHALPVFDALRVPSRFLGVATFHLALLAAFALDLLAWRSAPRRWMRTVTTTLAWLVVLGSAADIALVTRPIVDRWKAPPIEPALAADAFHLVHVADYNSRYARLPRENLGTTGCYEGAMRWKVAQGLWLGDQPQVRAPDFESVLESSRTPSRLSATIDAPAPMRLIWNSNFDPGWQANVGAVVDDAGRLAVDVPAGRHRLEVQFRPPHLAPALTLSTLGLALSIALLASRRLRRALRLEGALTAERHG